MSVRLQHKSAVEAVSGARKLDPKFAMQSNTSHGSDSKDPWCRLERSNLFPSARDSFEVQEIIRCRFELCVIHGESGDL